MDSSIDTLKSQLLQLKTLHDAGALGQAEYESSKAALERRVLDLVLAGSAQRGVDTAAPTGTAPPAGPVVRANVKLAVSALPSGDAAAQRPSRRMLALLGTAVLVVAVGGYALTGSPSLLSASSAPGAAPGQAAGAAPHAVSAAQIEEMTERLAARLKEQPQDAQGWAMLGRSYSVLGRNDEAVKAYRTAVEQQGDDAMLLADFADALAMQNNRVLAGEPMKWVRRALEIDPKNVKALALAGTDAFDRKDFAGAVKLWEKLLEYGPSDAGFADQVKSSIAEARERGGLGPSAQLPPSSPAQPAAATAPRANATQAPAGQGANAALPAQATQPAQATLAATVSGTVSLSAALAAKAGPDDTVFIFARPADGSRMPLAVLRKRVRDLPVRFTLDDSMAMSPAAKISGSPRVIVAARISKSGEAMSSPGDLVGQVGPVALGSTGLALEIGGEVKP